MPKLPLYRPKEISIGGHVFSIQYKQMEDFGRMDIDKRTILLKKNMGSEETFDTLLHEAVHACLSLSGLGYLIDNENLEEALVRALENLMIPTFKREHLHYIKQTE